MADTVGRHLDQIFKKCDSPADQYCDDKRFGIQFAPVANGTIYNTPNADSIIAAKICLEGYTLSDEIIYFLNPAASTSSWITNNRPYAFTIGKHTFYK